MGCLKKLTYCSSCPPKPVADLGENYCMANVCLVYLYCFSNTYNLFFMWRAMRRIKIDNDYLGRLAPYLERPCLRSFTPPKSRFPRTQ